MRGPVELSELISRDKWTTKKREQYAFIGELFNMF
jgi:hypothetical protein